jgi:hypothetical protein
MEGQEETPLSLGGVEGDSSSDDELKKKDKPTEFDEDVYDEDVEDLMIDAPMREFKYSGGIFKKRSLAFNPLTSFIGFAVLWSVSIW